ncbi:response regulator [Hyphomicrobium sp.]|jgi:DNA-binding response OmpR family regulator|uniref:response regulator n=1 Tax=Hyphomicrobium sp. TaxID=82 RepID=UPI002C6C491C|nr:response regulator [Hyphomicrobium sp.]HVZ05643.1 response regulator [Hyphomicrobium sp.]
MVDPGKQSSVNTVLVVEDEVLVRMPIAQYLRECGYRVIEAANVDEAFTVLQNVHLRIDVVFTAAEFAEGQDGFALVRWLREHRVNVKVVMAGTAKRAANIAGTLCEEGPMLRKPYHSSTVEKLIRRLMANKESDRR